MADKYYIDFETRSDYNIKEVSTFKYLTSPNAGVLCLAWNKNQTKTNLWLPGMPPPFDPSRALVYGFNLGTFDLRVWNMITARLYGFAPLHLDNCVDVQALCARWCYPQGLERVGEVLKVKVKKDKRGAELIRKCCQPPFNCTQDDLRGLYKYCVRDVDSMIEIINALPTDYLEDTEQRIWQVTIRMNTRGVPVDTRSIRRIKEVVDHYKTQEAKNLPILTDNAVRTPGQHAAIREWLIDKGIELPNLQAATVEATLERTDLPPIVRRVLELRQELGKSSVAKYSALLALSYMNKVYDNLRYYRANTGRYGGQGFQAHNLPRATVEDVEATLAQFRDGSILSGDVMYAAKALIRSMIMAPMDKVLCVSDFSSIEYILLMWLAREWEWVQKFADKRDPYKDQGVSLFNKPYEEITKDERQKCKPVVLGAGYMLGPTGLIEYAKQYRVEMTPSEAEQGVNSYRHDRPKVVKMWYALRDCSLYAVTQPGQDFEANGCVFRVIRDRNGRAWLRLRLPSGRALFYNDPKIQEGMYGYEVTFMGEHSTTHQWIRMALSAPRIVENIIQALGRDLLCYAQNLIENAGYELILSVHDETVTVIHESGVGVRDINIHKLMQTPPDWCKDLPLRADTFVTKRYRKG